MVPQQARGKANSLPIIGDLYHLSDALHGELARLHPSILGADEGGRRSWTRAVSSLQGFRSLYAGLGPTMVGVVPTAVVYMPTYEFSKAALQGSRLEGSPVPGMLTGLASALVRVPISVVKSQLQLKLHHNALAVIRSLTNDSKGWRGLYRGLEATIVLDCTYAVVQFGCLEQFRSLALRWHQWWLRDASPEAQRRAPQDASQLSTGMNMAIGFGTGVVTSIVTEPIDVIRTRLMAQRETPATGSHSSTGTVMRRGNALATDFGYRGFLDGLRVASRQEGVLALWQGLLPRMVTKATGSTIWYTTYMEVREWLCHSRQREPARPG